MVYIYALIDTKNELCGYVGQATYPEVRFQEHINDGYRYSNPNFWVNYGDVVTDDRAKWIGFCIAHDNGLIMHILEMDLRKGYEADRREDYWIAEMTKRGEPLTNFKYPERLFEEMGIERFQAYPNCPYLKKRREETGKGLDLSYRTPGKLYDLKLDRLKAYE